MGCWGAKVSNSTRTASGLEYQVLRQGTGPVAKRGQSIKVHYTGTLSDGTKFDSSLDRGQPFEFQIGGGKVISGWDDGMIGMKVGEKRKLIIPPKLAYGDRRMGPLIAPNSTLIFEVELLDVQ